MKKLIQLFLILTAIAVLFIGCDADLSTSDNSITSSNNRGSMSQVSSFGSNPGSLAMYKYVPSGISGSAPLVIAMHGCTQTAADYANSGWKDMADQYKFYVVFPQQNSSNNQNKCFNWFEPGDIARDYGESKSVKSMIDKMKSDYSISSVYVNGFSAGGYMAPVIFAVYPDVINGMSVNAGGPYKCATSMNAAFSCMSPGTNKSPSAWGDLVRNASSYDSQIAGKKVIIFQGDSDYTVKEMNATELSEQWQNLGAIVDKNIISGLGHNVPITSASGCGSGFSYTDDNKGICSVKEAVIFWGLDGTSGDGDGDGDGDCTEVTATNSTHVTEGRATSQSSGWWWYATTTYYAVGSNDNLGTSGSTSTTLNSTDGNTWSQGACSTGGDGDGDTGGCNSCSDNSCCQAAGCSGWSSFYGFCYSGVIYTKCSCWQ